MSNKYNITLNFANDVGFSSLKGRIFADGEKPESVFVPSIKEPISTDEQNLALRDSNDVQNKSNIASFMDSNIFNHMAVHFDDDDLNGDYYIGQSADIHGGRGFTAMQVVAGQKGDTPLAPQLTYSVIAYKALKYYYDHNNHQLPSSDEPLNVRVSMLVALPETEASLPGTQSKYARRYKNGKFHNVEILNFKDSDSKNSNPKYNIHVNIKVDHIGVGVEGAVALNAVNTNNKTLLASFKNQYQEHYPNALKRMRAHASNNIINKIIMNTSNTLCMDFGEVTSDLVIMRNGQFEPNLSKSYNIGCHNILITAVNNLRRESSKKNNPFNGIYPKLHVKDVQRFMYQTQHKLKTQKYLTDADIQKRDDFNRAIKEATPKVIRQLLNFDIVHVVGNPNADYDKVIVFGGGAIALSNYGFESALRKNMKKLRPGVPVLFVDKDESQLLNVKGLECNLQNILKKHPNND